MIMQHIIGIHWGFLLLLFCLMVRAGINRFTLIKASILATNYLFLYIVEGWKNELHIISAYLLFFLCILCLFLSTRENLREDYKLANELILIAQSPTAEIMVDRLVDKVKEYDDVDDQVIKVLLFAKALILTTKVKDGE
jgi:hypothetical protein